jgi:hypothetical protein
VVEVIVHGRSDGSGETDDGRESTVVEFFV